MTMTNSQTQAAGIPWAMAPGVSRTVAVLLLAALTALSAIAQVRLPGMQVPLTMQTMFVVLSGLLLGARLGAGTQALYVAVGALGLPVFAGGGAGPGWLLGPTGGYLLAFPLAAFTAGWLGERLRGDARSAGAVLWLAAAAACGMIVIYIGGAAQLTLLTADAGTAVRMGVLPFVAADTVKALLAVLIAQRIRHRTLRLR
jgi:biotin transport system substrate-specific component